MGLIYFLLEKLIHLVLENTNMVSFQMSYSFILHYLWTFIFLDMIYMDAAKS